MTDDLINLSSRNAKSRIALILVAFAALVFGWFAIRWQFGNLIADTSNPGDLSGSDAADLAVALAPSDPLARWLKASFETNLRVSDESTPALQRFEETVRLSPYDYRWWIELGHAYEQGGLGDRAEGSFKRATVLAPAYAFPRWQLGNFYLRRNRPDLAFGELRAAAENSETYRQDVFSLAWEYFDKDASKLEQFVPNKPEVYIGLALFYAVRGRAADSLRIWNSLTADDKASRPDILKLIAQGLYERRFYPQALDFARELGIDADARPEKVTNAGFEKPVGSAAESRFGWKVVRNDSHFDVTGDSNVRHEGSKSLKVTFRTYNKPDLYNISQTVVVESNKHYRLRFWVRTENLKSSGQPLINVFNANDDKLLASSKAFQPGTNEWQEFTVEFVTPDNCSGVTIATGRAFCGDTCPIVGIFWYDGFDISRQ